MAFETETSSNIIGGGGYLNEPGTYHCFIASVVEGMSGGKNPKPINGFTAELTALAGTVSDCEGKAFSLSLFNPRPDGTLEQQERNKRQITAFLIAGNLIQPQHLGKRLNVELEQSVGSQLFIKLRKRREKNEQGEYVDTKFLELDFENIFHVDDPRATDFPRDESSIKDIGKDFRRNRSFFSFLGEKYVKSPAEKPQATQPASAASLL